MTRDEILDFLKAHREELRQTFGVQEIALFGSYTRGSANSECDIDSAVEIVDDMKNLTKTCWIFGHPGEWIMHMATNVVHKATFVV